MRKIYLLMALLLLILAGCSNSNAPKIEDYNWVMTSVQSMDTGEQAIAYGERGSSTLDSAKQIELICCAEDGNLTLTDQTNDETYTGTYTMNETDTQSSIYEIVLDGNEGMAVVAMTTYHDGSQEPTFIINLGDYAINFFAE